MATVKVTHGGNDHHLFEGETSVKVTRTIGDIRNPGITDGDFVQKMLLPADGQHAGHINDLHAANAYQDGALTVQDTLVNVDGETVIRGRGRITGLTRNLKPQATDLSIEGTNLEWKKGLETKKLQDLDLGTVSYTKAVVEDSWTAVYDTYGCNFFPVSYGEFGGVNGVKLEDLRPQIPIRYIIEKILEGQGWTLNSTFLTSATFTKYHWLFIGQNFKQTDDYVDNLLFKATRSSSSQIINNLVIGTPQHLSFDTEVFDNGNNFVSSEYTTSNAGEMRFQLKNASFANVGSTEFPVYNIQIVRKRGTSITVLAETGTTTPSAGAISLDTGYWFFQASDKVYCRIDPVINITDMEFQTGATFENSATNRIVETATFDLAGTFPGKFTQLWFIQQMAKALVLRCSTNPNTKTVTMEPFADAYKAKSLAVDWTEKIDRLTDFEDEFMGADLKREQHFTYSRDKNDGYLSHINPETEEEFASHTHELPERFNSGRDTHKLDFAPTITLKDTKITTSGVAEMPRLWDSYLVGSDRPKQSFDFLPRIVYYEGVDSSVTWNWYDGTPTVGFPTAYFSEANPSSDPENSLSFANHTNNSGIFSRYIFPWLKTLRDGRLRKCRVALHPSEVANLDFFKLIKIDDETGINYWGLNSITVNHGSNDLAEVELFKYVTAAASEAASENTTSQNDVTAPLPHIPFPQPIGTSGGVIDSGEEGLPYGRLSNTVNNGTGNYAEPGVAAFAAGEGTRATGPGQMAVGRFNVADPTALFIVGSGENANNRVSGYKISTDTDGSLKETVNGQTRGAGVANCVIKGATVTIPTTNQHVVWGEMKVLGLLNIRGELIIK